MLLLGEHMMKARVSLIRVATAKPVGFRLLPSSIVTTDVETLSADASVLPGQSVPFR